MYTYPGVYVEELPGGARPIAGLEHHPGEALTEAFLQEQREPRWSSTARAAIPRVRESHPASPNTNRSCWSEA